MIETLSAFTEQWPWGIYICLLLAPFVQEDAAVILGASTASMSLAPPLYLFLALLLGLCLSDIWKYWAGRWARTHHRANWLAAHRRVGLLRERVVDHLGSTMIIARFVPGTRIPIYLASGFFKARFDFFTLWIIAGATLYILLAFVLFHYLGEVGGEKARTIAPLIAIAVVAVVLIWQTIRMKREDAEDASNQNQADSS